MYEIIQMAQKKGYWDPKPELGRREDDAERIAVLDPTFWHALGLCCGWRMSFTAVDPEWQTLSLEEMEERNPIHQAIKFHKTNLTEGWDKAVEDLKATIQKYECR